MADQENIFSQSVSEFREELKEFYEELEKAERSSQGVRRRETELRKLIEEDKMSGLDISAYEDEIFSLEEEKKQMDEIIHEAAELRRIMKIIIEKMRDLNGDIGEIKGMEADEKSKQQI